MEGSTELTVLQVRDLCVQFGGVTALSGVSFDVERGSICGLIGPNGAGKTTLFNVISRIAQPTRGSVIFDGVSLLDHAPHQISTLGVFRTFQNLALWERMSVLENVMAGAHVRASQNFVTAMLGLGRRREERRLGAQAYEILADLDLADVAFRPCAGLPYGTLKRIELARALMGGPELLMLDEPATGLTHAEVDELSTLIRRIRDDHDLTVLLVEHHMGLVMSITEHVVVLDFGVKIAEGDPRQVADDPQVQAAYLGTPA